MLKRFLPRQEGFFSLFQKAADLLVLTATQFHVLLTDLAHQQKSVDEIAMFEHEADTVAYTIFQLLHKTFITPFDRHDIHRLTSKMDDVIDLINRCAQRFPFYNLQTVPQQTIDLAELGVACAKFIKDATARLNSLAKSDEIIKFCENIDALESKAHKIYLAGEKELFLDDQDFKTFFKLKEISTQTKNVISGCQDVANIIKGIVLEYS